MNEITERLERRAAEGWRICCACHSRIQRQYRKRRKYQTVPLAHANREGEG